MHVDIKIQYQEMCQLELLWVLQGPRHRDRRQPEYDIEVLMSYKSYINPAVKDSCIYSRILNCKIMSSKKKYIIRLAEQKNISTILIDIFSPGHRQQVSSLTIMGSHQVRPYHSVRHQGRCLYQNSTYKKIKNHQNTRATVSLRYFILVSRF